jgi:hypothetical protein
MIRIHNAVVNPEMVMECPQLHAFAILEAVSVQVRLYALTIFFFDISSSMQWIETYLSRS